MQFSPTDLHHFSDTAQSDLIPLRGRRIFFDLIMKRAPDPGSRPAPGAYPQKPDLSYPRTLIY